MQFSKLALKILFRDNELTFGNEEWHSSQHDTIWENELENDISLASRMRNVSKKED